VKPNDLDLAMRTLVMHKDFRTFLLRIVEQAGIFTPTAGAEQSLQYREGQRSLGLDMLRLAARGLPRGTREPNVIDVLSILLRDSTPKETDNDRTDQPERIDQLAD
jgi:hypothetical protein